jgi:type 1 glutamine amidotransferase
MKNFIILSLLAGFFNFSYCCGQNKIEQDTKTKIILIPGTDSHGIGEHEFVGGCRLLAKLLNENVQGVEATVTEQGWPADTTVLDSAAAILIYSDGAERHVVIPHMAHIQRLEKKGTGLINLHFAVEIPKGEGGDSFLKWIGGYFETFYSVNPIWVAKFESFPKHPVTRGVNPFEVRDEWYYHIRFVENDQKLVPILRLLPPASTLNRPEGDHSSNPYVKEDVLIKKQPQTLAWAFTRTGGGRGFGFTGGHYHNNWRNDDYRKLVLNAILWVAKIDVPQNGVVTRKPTESELIALQKKPRQ